jgi:hypothetical protein
MKAEEQGGTQELKVKSIDQMTKFTKWITAITDY